jgi:hypothetical protein
MEIPSSIVTDIVSATHDFMTQILPIMVFYIGLATTFYSAREIRRLFPRSR